MNLIVSREETIPFINLQIAALELPVFKDNENSK
jgi:hypothetical protein